MTDLKPGTKIVPVLSGGLDSTTLVYDAVSRGAIVSEAVSFNYGQRHKKELEYAAETCYSLGIRHYIIDLHNAGLTDAIALSGSALVDSKTDVPEGHYGEESMKATVVPNRNMMMLSIAGSIAVANGANMIATGVHAGDHFIYPDCRPDFINTASKALYKANEGFGNLFLDSIWTPYLFLSKDDIAYRALELEVPLHETWSCYKGGEKHCGRCGTCVERLEAINNAISTFQQETTVWKEDHTEYEDETFWASALERPTV